MNTKTVLLAAGIAFFVSFAVANVVAPSVNPTGLTASAAGILDRGEIRVGYAPYPPEALIKDPNTGELSGLCHDVLEEAAKNLGLKVVWAEEVNFGTMIEGLRTGRYDVATCVWPNAERSRGADFLIPVFYNAIGAYVKSSNKTLTEISKLNDPDVTIATIDGEMSAFLAKTTAPNARTLSLPQDTPSSQSLLNVHTGKADVAFADAGLAEEFMAHNPRSLKNIASENPVAIFAVTYMVSKDDQALASMLNAAIEGLINNGTVDSLIKKYQKYPDSIYPVAKPHGPALR